MFFTSLIRRITGADRRDELVGHIARRSYATVRNAVSERVSRMTPSEARGYVRVKATPVIRESSNTWLRRETHLTARQKIEISNMALEQLVITVTRDLRATRGQQKPRRRMAA